MPRLALYLLGPPRFELDGELVHLSRSKALALLVYLALTRQHHRRDALAALLWPEHDQRTARAYLRRALAAVRTAVVEALLDADRETIGLNLDAEVWSDVHAFRTRLATCRTHGHPADQTCPDCLPALAEAVSFYRGDLLAGFTLPDCREYDDWQFFQTQALRDELAGALQRLVHAYSAQREFEQAIACARRWLALDPLHEPAHRTLMQLYAWSGQRAASLRQYKECERVLQEELGAPPEKATVQLYQAIQHGHDEPAPVIQPAAAAPAPQARRHNLPAQLIPFMGRRRALDEIADCLQDPGCRLLTLIGPGGSGKTRLALEAAAEQLDRYAHGVFFVPLAPLDAANGIVPAIAEALGFSFHGEGDPRQQLLRYLQRREVLLILDNYEHLLDGAVLATEILEAAPQAKVLATSRARLNVQGEYVYPVGGMNYPTSIPSPKPGRGEPLDITPYSAIRLFVASACRAQPHFALTEEALPHLVRICQLVEGMPLGLLLAAAWAGTLAPAEIADEIERSLDFLGTDWRGVPARQQSVRAVFDHSWRLLTGREQEIFRALSVFRGGLTRQAAERVVGASLRELTALVNKSLLHRLPTGRFELHELLRQYAAEQLAASPAIERQVRDRHCAYYAAALQQWEAELKGSRQYDIVVEMDAESENARVAWDWAVKRVYVDRLDQAMDGLCRFYEWRARYAEGEAACRAAAEVLGEMPPADDRLRVRAKATAWRGAFLRAMRRLDQARDLLGDSLAQLGELSSAGQDVRQEQAFALWQTGYTLYDIGHGEDAQQHYQSSLSLYRALGDRWATAAVLYHLGDLLHMLGAYKDAEKLIEEGLAIQQALSDHRGTAGSLRVLGVMPTCPLEESERLLRQSATAFQAAGDRAHAAETLINLGTTLALLGKPAEAHLQLEKSVAIFEDLGFSGSSSSIALTTLGMADLWLGKYEEARDRAQMGLALAREQEYRLGVQGGLLTLGQLAIAEGRYAQAQQLLQQSRDQGEGGRMSHWTLPDSAVAAHALGQPDKAWRHICEALRWASERGDFVTLLQALPATALLLADRGEVERAVELYALASRYPSVANSRVFEDVAAAAAALPPDVISAAQERGRKQDLDQTIRELLDELAHHSHDHGTRGASCRPDPKGLRDP